MSFEPPPKHRVDGALWWLIRDRSSVVMAVVSGTLVTLCAAIRLCVLMTDLKIHWPFFVIVSAAFYLIDCWMYRVILESFSRRVAWQTYWDHVYRDGDIIRSKP